MAPLRILAFAALLALVALPAAAAPALAEEADEVAPSIVLATPSITTSIRVPGATGPPVPGITYRSPGVIVPGTCTQEACWASASVPGFAASTPGVSEYVATPAIATPRTCAPGNVACVEPFGAPGFAFGPLAEVPPQTFEFPGATVPAPCEAAREACTGPIVVERATLLATPDLGPTSLTPPLELAAFVPGFSTTLGPGLLATQPAGPFAVAVPMPVGGDLVVTLCSDACALPGLAGEPVDSTGDASLSLGAGDEAYGFTVATTVEP